MIISKILINNFRQYRDQIINLTPPTKEKNFTIIQGTNGSGKSNLLNSITWCLYGEEIHRAEKFEGLPLLNTFTSKNMQNGDKERVKVEIHMKDDENLFIFRRCQEYEMKNGKIKKIE